MRLPLAFLAAVALGVAGCSPAGPAQDNESSAAQGQPPAASQTSLSAEVPKPDPPLASPKDVDGGTASETGGVTRVDKARTEALLAETEGKVLVVNLWATWCLPCIAEMPHLSGFYNGMDSESTAFLSLSADGPRFIDEAVVPFVKEHNLPFPVYALDFEDPDPLILAGMLGVQETGWDGALPATFVFDRDGQLVRHWFEEIKPGELEATVTEISGAN